MYDPVSQLRYDQQEPGDTLWPPRPMPMGGFVSDSRDFASAQAEVLKALAKKSYSPEQLMQTLRESGFREDVVRAATWDLIDRRQVTLTRDWQLKSGGPTPNGAHAPA